MTDKEGAGVTVISHDTENRTHVDGCDPHGCYERYVTYTSVLFIQLEALTDVSARCVQCISYEFLNFRLLEGEKVGWVSRGKRKMAYWGGTNEKRQCGCALTDSCAHRDKKCNCDYRDKTWRGLEIQKRTDPRVITHWESWNAMESQLRTINDLHIHEICLTSVTRMRAFLSMQRKLDPATPIPESTLIFFS